jgi:general secretion pathway protein N
VKTIRWIGMIVAALLGSAIALAAFAPASLADAALRSVTSGRLALAETSGTVWRGSGRIVLIDVARARPEGNSGKPQVLSGVAIPGRLDWDLRALPLLVGVVDAAFRLEGMAAPVRLAGNLAEVRIGAGGFALPSVELGRLGSPWNTFRPVASLALRWEGMAFRNTGFEGRATIELRDLASALSPVRPLGSYRIEVVGSGASTAVTMATLAGPLQLTGNGTWNARTGLSFRGLARSDPSEEARIRSFLNLVGKREGDATVITIGQ